MSVASPSSLCMSLEERLAAPSSPRIPTFDGSCHPRFGFPPPEDTSDVPRVPEERMFDHYPVLPRRGVEHTSPRFAKGYKVVKTSFDNRRNCEVKNQINKEILDLARTTRAVYVAKIQYQRLRMQELELMKCVVRNELEEAQGCLHQMEHQIGQIRQDVLDGSGTVDPNYIVPSGSCSKL